MIGYRLYFYSSNNDIVGRDAFLAETQEDALARLQSVFLARKFPIIELWDEQQFVQRLERAAT